MSQWRFPLRCSTRCDRSAFTSTSIARLSLCLPCNSRPSCLTMTLRAPSAPNRYFDRILYCWPVTLSSTVEIIVLVAVSSSNDKNLVSIRHLKPLTVAYRSRIGSRSVCGRSTCRQGEAPSYSPYSYVGEAREDTRRSLPFDQDCFPRNRFSHTPPPPYYAPTWCASSCRHVKLASCIHSRVQYLLSTLHAKIISFSHMLEA